MTHVRGEAVLEYTCFLQRGTIVDTARCGCWSHVITIPATGRCAQLWTKTRGARPPPVGAVGYFVTVRFILLEPPRTLFQYFRQGTPQPTSSSRCAGPRTPFRAIASRDESRGARPRATDHQLVGIGQGGCALPSGKEGVCEFAGRSVFGSGDARVYRAAAAEAARGKRRACRVVRGRLKAECECSKYVARECKRSTRAHLEHAVHARDAGRVKPE